MPGAGEGSLQRTYLFLQGPLSPLYRRIGAGLAVAGHRVRRINFCPGDWLHWNGPQARSYRGSLRDWPDAIAERLIRDATTDLVLHGDMRPYHRPAVLAAEALGITVHVTELGLLRPGFMTLERGGLGVLSRFPDDPKTIRALADAAGPVDLDTRYPGSFALEAWQDVSYHLPNTIAAWAFYPHYRRHTPLPALLDYAYWLARLSTAPHRRYRAKRAYREVVDSMDAFFLLPLQVEGDYQVIAQSPYRGVVDGLREILFSYAAHAPENVRLVVKAHPLDNGATNWRGVLRDLARDAKIDPRRLVFLDGGRLDALLRRASGVVTINSTAGLEALRAGVPVKTLAPALYDIDGMTDHAPLSRFWSAPEKPDPTLVDAFIRALAASTQMRGTIHNTAGLDAAVSSITARLLAPERLPHDAFVEPPPRLARARALGMAL